MEDLDFIGGDPGAVRHGNFINYYQFHSPEERTKNFTEEMLPSIIDKEKCLCLDIGCNAGNLTQEFYKLLVKAYPNKEVFLVGIDVDPALIKRAIEDNEHENITFHHFDVMSDEWSMFMSSYLENHKVNKFDITFCFSTIMWIHLNHGDEGLREFLQYLTDISNSLIVELQPWKCYKSAEKNEEKQHRLSPI